MTGDWNQTQTRPSGEARVCWSRGPGARGAPAVAGTSQASGVDSARPPRGSVLVKHRQPPFCQARGEQVSPSEAIPPCCRDSHGLPPAGSWLFLHGAYPPALYPERFCLPSPLTTLCALSGPGFGLVPTSPYPSRMHCTQPLRICCLRGCAVEGDL